jgi:hypothetical protein
MTTKELANYKPYGIGRFHDGYADITFQNEGIMTVPKKSSSAIVDMLNDAFKNGIKMACSDLLTPEVTPFIKPSKMPEEELHTNYRKR